jgi:hypothetical protein
VHWHGNGEVHAELALPWALLRTLDQPAAALAANLQWPTLPAVLAVSRLRLSIDDMRQLEPGGAVVLPDSLSAAWIGWLRASDEPAVAGCGVPVDMSTPFAPQLAKSAPRTVVPAPEGALAACEVRLGQAHALPADRLGGWCTDQVLDIACGQAALWRCAGAAGPAQQLASGRLMPWGDGWALALESLDDAETTLIQTR